MDSCRSSTDVKHTDPASCSSAAITNLLVPSMAVSSIWLFQLHGDIDTCSPPAVSTLRRSLAHFYFGSTMPMLQNRAATRYFAMITPAFTSRTKLGVDSWTPRRETSDELSPPHFTGTSSVRSGPSIDSTSDLHKTVCLALALTLSAEARLSRA